MAFATRAVGSWDAGIDPRIRGGRLCWAWEWNVAQMYWQYRSRDTSAACCVERCSMLDGTKAAPTRPPVQERNATILLPGSGHDRLVTRRMLRGAVLLDGTKAAPTRPPVQEGNATILLPGSGHDRLVLQTRWPVSSSGSFWRRKAGDNLRIRTNPQAP